WRRRYDLCVSDRKRRARAQNRHGRGSHVSPRALTLTFDLMDEREAFVPPSLRGLTVLRVRGIPLRLHWTLGAMILYLAWVFSLRFAQLAQQQGGPGALPPLGWGFLVSVGLFVGVALHELGHSLLALAFGGKVRAITLTFIGGVSEIDEMPRHGL